MPRSRVGRIPFAKVVACSKQRQAMEQCGLDVEMITVVVVGKWKSRAVGGISKVGGKAFFAFPSSVSSTTAVVMLRSQSSPLVTLPWNLGLLEARFLYLPSRRFSLTRSSIVVAPHLGCKEVPELCHALGIRKCPLGHRTNHILRLIGQEEILRFLELLEATPFYFNRSGRLF